MPQCIAENVAVAFPSTRRSGVLGVSWPLLAGLAGFLFPAALGWGLGDPDIYWHIVSGRWMLEHGRVPMHDPFSFTMHGAGWVAQEWATELAMAGCYLVGGWSGLVLLAAACFGATLAYVLRFLLARMEPLHALLLTSLAACMAFPYLSADPQALVWPLTVVWVGSLIASSEDNRAPPWWLLAVMLAWANLHGSFILGLLLAIALGTEATMKARPVWRAAANRWALFVTAALCVALMNPRGYELLLFPFKLLAMKSALALVAAWQPPDFQKPQVLDLWLLLIVTLGFAGRARLSFVRSVLLVGLLYIALQHARNVPLLGLISPLLLARPLAAQWRAAPLSGRDAYALDQWFYALSRRAGIGSVCVALLAGGIVAIAALDTRKPHPPDVLTPRAAVDALLSRGPPGRVFNDFNFGGYLIFRGIPVFVDARVDMYGNAFSARVMESQALVPRADLEGLLAKYKVDSILLSPTRPAVELLDHLPQWQRLYADDVAVVYVRRKERGS